MTEGTRETYLSSKKSYEFFCGTRSVPAWPAKLQILGEYIAYRGTGGTGKYSSKCKGDVLRQHIVHLRSVHVDRRLPTDLFNHPWLVRILAGIKRCNHEEDKKKAAPLNIEILEKISALPPQPSIEDINFSVASKVAFAGFMRSGEFTYTQKDLDKADTFSKTKLTRSDITFGGDNEYAILRLKRSKTDTDHEGIDIMLAATPSPTCPVAALRFLFKNDPQPTTAPLFSRGSNQPFTYQFLRSKLTSRLQECNVPDFETYTGHSWRRGAAQHAYEMGLPENMIQRLGRWTSDAFKGYFTVSITEKFILSRRFLIGTAPALQL